ncbi:unnamed protein product [Cuscuta europaea]|uniref:Auxin-responsive protein n=1 Tax=Cuscuta europaea TaxID=41803 RepID=A0A9P0YPU7_CUSEU|nr:unnamed protein product [Cuscuta europaea]
MEPNLAFLGGGGDAELELGLGLSIRTGPKPAPSPSGKGGGAEEECGRIFTAKDFLNGFHTARPNAAAFSGAKRAAESVVGPPSTAVNRGTSQVVGWPPIRSYRMNSLVNQGKAPNAEDDIVGVAGNEKKKENSINKMSKGNNDDDGCAVKEKGNIGFVKVNMDGLPIGRKVDVSAHTCYESLAEMLEQMFFKSGSNDAMNAFRGGKEQRARPSKLLDGSSEFALTYEDKEGDWMLVGDVPWGMFLSTVKRLRILKTSEAKGLAPGIQERHERRTTKPI